jgi:hypothetical protein
MSINVGDESGRDTTAVVPGLDPGIHLQILTKTMDCRVKPGNDERGVCAA